MKKMTINEFIKSGLLPVRNRHDVYALMRLGILKTETVKGKRFILVDVNVNENNNGNGNGNGNKGSENRIRPMSIRFPHDIGVFLTLCAKKGNFSNIQEYMNRIFQIMKEMLPEDRMHNSNNLFETKIVLSEDVLKILAYYDELFRRIKKMNKKKKITVKNGNRQYIHGFGSFLIMVLGFILLDTYNILNFNYKYNK